jgi:hypothetical protein
MQHRFQRAIIAGIARTELTKKTYFHRRVSNTV